MTAQVSLYPLYRESLSPAIDEVLQIFRDHALYVDPGPMSTLISGDDTSIFAALQEAYCRVAEQGFIVMVVTLSNAFPPVSGKTEEAIVYKAIGHVRNDFDEPVGPDTLRSTESRIILDATLVDGLHGLEPGKQIAVIFHFHLSEGFELRQHPRGDTSRPNRGVFALRSPHRPNAIGLSVVDLLEVRGNVLRVRGLDAINGTPVLDIKPL
ncbi:MAG: tRNA (N6-threonylcarbamoyladenosine(37)-N6)-methyltransferase TrmO [Candidatus Neomarinimicrobiota bacterium]